MAPKTKQPYFPQYEVDFKGHDSPGMSLYNPRFKPVTEQIPVFSIQKGPRGDFAEEKNRVEKG